jgi:hypothetical protein
MGEKMIGKRVRYGVLAVALWAGSAMAMAAPVNLKAKFNSEGSKQAWPHIEKAMTVPMPELLDKATEFNPAYVLEYGLALELGRPAETLNERQAGRMSGAFQNFLNTFLRKSDNIKLEGDESALLKMPDFWIILAKNLARHQSQMSFSAGSLSTGSGTAAGISFTMMDLSGGSDEAKYSLGDDKALNRYMVYASQSCAIYAKLYEQMKAVQLVDASELSHLTPEQQVATKTDAVRVYRATATLGPQACGSADRFEKTTQFATQYLGKLATMKRDPNATLANTTGE